MKFQRSQSLSTRTESDVLILPFWKEKNKAVPACDLHELLKEVKAPLTHGDFDGTHGKGIFVYSKSKTEPRLLLLGLGEEDKITADFLRRAAGKALELCKDLKLTRISLLVPPVKEMGEEVVVRGFVEGLLIRNYCFDELKTKTKEDKSSKLESVTLIGISPKNLSYAKELALVDEGASFSRDLVNRNADVVTPAYLCNAARDMAKKDKRIKVEILGVKELQKHKMGLILAVGQGARHPPALITLNYRGAPKSKDLTVVIGKGVTFDTGGLNLKGTGHIEDMKCDMAGGAAALGLMKAVSALDLKVNLTVIVPTAENSIDANSYKPGDVYTSYLGKTVEVNNTDAEGRLILADALAYAAKTYKPTRMINMATLTGAIVIALGDEVAGVMSNNDALADSIIRSGMYTFERCWRLPLFPEYRELLDSKIADLKNSGGRPGGSITAGLFLKEFVGDTPWAHIDIAGTAYLDAPKRYHPIYATGFGVRLLVDFLKNVHV